MAQEIANAVHNQELLSMVIYHPMWNELVTLDQFLLQAGVHITSATITAGNKWSLFAVSAERLRTK